MSSAKRLLTSLAVAFVSLVIASSTARADISVYFQASGDVNDVFLGANIIWSASCAINDPRGSWMLVTVNGPYYSDQAYYDLGSWEQYGSVGWSGEDVNPGVPSSTYNLTVTVGYLSSDFSESCQEEASASKTVTTQSGEGGGTGGSWFHLLDSGASLSPGQSVDHNGYSFIYQNDGNLVLYLNGTPLWWSGTDGTSPGDAIMQTDGNLVIYDSDDVPIWWTGTDGDNGAYLVLHEQNDSSQSRPWIAWGDNWVWQP